MQPETIKLMGGALCLDFANSTDWTAENESIEVEDALLESDSLVRWGRRVGLIAAGAGGDGAIAAELAAARELRPALRGVLIAAAHGDAPPGAAVDLLTRTYAEAAAAARLTPRGDGAYVLDWPDDDPRKVRFAVVADAIALLADAPRLVRVHVCPGRDCGWLFLNTSGRQRWCSMATCGSRAKMRAMYARRRAEASS
jgi:predicted RNA-binding Zn ribbon-like protein